MGIFYYQGLDCLECSNCGAERDIMDFNICPLCNMLICKDCSDEEGLMWCPDCNVVLDDLENFIEEEEE